MGTVEKIGNQDIIIGEPDHGAPHVHVIGGGVRLSVSLSDFSVKGSQKQAQEAKKAIKWIKKNKDMLIKTYNELNG